MRTGIYVFKPGEVTVQPLDPEDRELTITPYNPDHPEYPAVGTLNLAAGVYLIVSRGELRVSGDHIRVETVASDKDPWPTSDPGVVALEQSANLISTDKDPWPEPPLDVLALEPGATQASIEQFFQIAKGVDL